jgi:hypothetical protein
MGIHQTLKHCAQCGHAAELHVEVCPKCKTVFDPILSKPPESAEPIDASLTAAEIIANMQEKKSKESSQEHVHVEERTMSQVQNDAISQEKLEFNRRFKELFGKKSAGDEKK